MTCDKCGKPVERHQKFITIKINGETTYRHERCPKA